APDLAVRYRFTHDRVQQAAYAMIADAERETAHARIGRLLLEQAPEGPALEEQLFEIVGHLNKGRASISAAAERGALCRLNLHAAQRAQTAAAHGTALELANVALELLGSAPYQADHGRAYAAELMRAECGYLSGNAQLALAAIESIERHARTRLERVPA